MLQSMRENMKGTIAIIIVIFLGLILAIGLVDLNTFNTNNTAGEVANVNDRAITENELQLAIAQERQRLQVQFRGSLPAEFLSDERLRGPALEGLIQRNVLLDKALAGKMRISDEELNDLIIQMPEFQKEGRFDSQLFVQKVRGIGHTPASFKVLLRDDLLVNQLRSGVASTAFVTNNDLKSIVALSRQTRDFTWIKLPLAGLPETMKVSEDEMKQYYDENKASFKTDEQVSVEYIEIKVSDFADQVIVGDDEIKQQYQQELEQFATTTVKQAAHIMIEGDDENAQKKIAEVKGKLAEGEDFAELAKTYSDDFGSRENGGLLGEIGADTLLPDAFKEAVATLEQGEISEPIKIDNATHFIKSITPNPPTFEERKDQIVAELKTLQAEPIFVEKLNSLKDLSFNAKSLKEVAEKLSLTLGTTGLFSRDGGSEQVLNDGRVVSAAFSDDVLQKGHSSEVLELTPDHAVVVKLIKHEPVRTLTLEEKRDDILAVLQLEKAKAQLAEQADTFKESLASGATLSAIAEQNGLELKTETKIVRDGSSVPKALVEHVFQLPRPNDEPVTSSLSLDSNDYALVSLSSVKDASFDEMSDEEKRSARLSLARNYSIGEFQAFQQRLLSKADIERN